MDPPDPPTGYGDPTEYHRNDYFVAFLSFVLLVGLTELFFPGVIEWIIGALLTNADRFVDRNAGRIVGVFGLVAVLVPVHEGVHYLASKRLGYSPRFGFRVNWLVVIPQPTPYVVTVDEYFDRWSDIIVLIAPLVVIDAIALVGLIPVFPPAVGRVSKLVLILNTASSGADMYNATRVLLSPPGTRFINCFDDGELRTFYTEPLPEARG